MQQQQQQSRGGPKSASSSSAGVGPGSPSKRPTSLNQILDDPPSKYKNRPQPTDEEDDDDDEDVDEAEMGGRGTRGGSTLGQSSVHSDKLLMTTRFEHEVGENGENYVITGRHGQIERCEDEVSC
jgi:hypothetical protein